MAGVEEMETSGSRSGDPLWQTIREQVQHEARRERRLSRLLHANVLDHGRLEDALAFVLSQKLASPLLGASVLREVCAEAFRGDREIGAALRRDLEAICQRDPACRGEWIPMLYYKGFHALAVHRASHWLWSRDQHVMALHLQNRASELFGVDIHPAARIGAGIFIDHATGVVMGETCVVEDDVSLLHEVTLGGTGKETGDRHPKVRRGVLICAGAKVLGNVEVGEGAKVAAGSVVLEDVPPHSTVAGVPAVLVGRPRVEQPALEMDSRLSTE